MIRAASILLALLALRCGGGPRAVPGTQVQMDFTRAAGLYAAPWPSEDLRRADGTIALAFPNAESVPIVSQAAALIARDARGFAASAGIFFALDGPIAPAGLPDLAASVTSEAAVFLLSVDPSSPDYLQRRPIEVSFVADGGPFGAPNLLAVLPLQGIPLRPRTSYAAVVLRRLLDASGRPLGVPRAMAEIAAGQRPRGMSAGAFDAYRRALAALGGAGVQPADIAGLAVFTTDDPLSGFGRVLADARARPLPALTAPFSLVEVFEEFCVYSAIIEMPVYQQGTPPYRDAGGDWAFDAAGRPILQRTEEANVVVTLPRRPPPEGGFPLAVFLRTGGGGDRPLVDRGPRATPGGEPLAPGTGPALHFARAGFAGLSIDGPHGGRRNVSGGDEQFLIFNLLNGAALRDNIRQSALEAALLPDVAAALEVPATDCPGLGSNARFDTGRLALMGHSMGATIAPLALAFETRYGAAILSGAGASWIENIVYKEKPLPVRALAELLLGYPEGTLRAHDPVLSLVQWAAEPADPQVYAHRIVREPPAGALPHHVLMFQGIVDHYILPRIANALTLSLGLDLAGEALDEGAGAPHGQTPLSAVLPHAGRRAIPLPASGNITSAGTPVTAVVVQHREDGIEDGHEVVFQTDPPKRQYRCFLESFARGLPSVPAGGGAALPCE
jgi:hypothetical protein